MVSGSTPSAVSCPSESLCMAVDEQGDALLSTDPTASAPSWSKAEIDHGGAPLNAVSCAPEGPCVAVDERGAAAVDRHPPSSAWSVPVQIDEGRTLTGVSCPTSSLCVAVDASGDVLTSTDPEAGVWSRAKVAEAGLSAVSCASASQCAAVDVAGEVLWSGEPTRGGAWHGQRVGFGELLDISCTGLAAASSSLLCAAGDGEGDALASEDPAASPPTWSITSVDLGQRLTSVSCASSGLCAAVDGRGVALVSDRPTSAAPAWASAVVDSVALTGVSCLPGGFCLAVDASGRSLSGRVPAPASTTLAPGEVTAASATLVAEVDPHDAVLGTCAFELGAGSPGGAYTQSLPCSPSPAANGGAQRVTAQIAGLAPNTAYHYRVLATSPAGSGAGGDVAFATAVSSSTKVVTPKPSITGTPAVGQVLSCHPGTPSGTQIGLAYAWLRDQIAIPSAVQDTYKVAGRDSGHHLQCQVTATNAGGSASARSAFVTVPAGGAPASVGETVVGHATPRGTRVSVPISCSPGASGGCEAKLRLQAVETLNGRRVVAVAATVRRAVGSHAASARHRTITLASTRVHVKAGAHVTATLVLGATARRLLSSRRRLPALLSVSGTVIGVIEAQLSRQRLTLLVRTRGGATHAARRARHARRPR